MLREELRYPDGRDVQLDIVALSGAVAIVPVDEEGRIVMVRQYRHGTGGEFLEIPAGTLEEDESPEVCAGRELREEAGLAPGKLIELGKIYPAPGFSTERITLFLADGLTEDAAEPDEDEVFSVERITVAEVFAMIERGEIEDAKTIVGMMLAKPYLDVQ